MDRALRGRGLLGVGKAKRPKTKGPSPSMTRDPSRSKRDTRSDSDDAWRKSLGSGEVLGLSVSGGIKGKPHSTKEGRIAAGVNYLNRFWGQKYKKKKGVPV